MMRLGLATTILILKDNLMEKYIYWFASAPPTPSFFSFLFWKILHFNSYTLGRNGNGAGFSMPNGFKSIGMATSRFGDEFKLNPMVSKVLN